ncbi:hypothetical protein WP4S18C04_19230 [Klebsiella pneumoniae]|jgi:hypothetical protein|uniref:hypothetical protein n=1 Tax=Klebsiella pneumoniae TaxID=573 RepID=UPI0015DD4E32|nr:hypothetical protein [Klebsiella pneumoniae]MDZ0955016.1 hypothetical protein [Klebsiella pneumoniae]BBR77337.1 hypothetical protein WP4S18C04_19230 [Klebsiella pneumoniae]HBS7134765.1 hypothetical protein [Klebsiella pneumoniae]HDG1062913.1 hypothetical protein [Klebsiella pneumoniae]HEB5184909.1 hypothetical protein [Klebsiella pneumoniae]
MESLDARKVVLQFLTELPDTIRTEELLLVLAYCGQNPNLNDSDSFPESIEKYLLQSGFPGIGAVLCARASIDYTLGDVNLKMIRAEEDLKALVAKHPDFPEAGLLGIPLRKRHYAAALEKWNALRANELSDENIRYFGRMFLSPRWGKN